MGRCQPGANVRLAEAALDLYRERDFEQTTVEIAKLAGVTNPDLLERQRVKLASFASAMAKGLRQRGIAASEATLVSERAVAVFRVGFERWVNSADTARSRS